MQPSKVKAVDNKFQHFVYWMYEVVNGSNIEMMMVENGMAEDTRITGHSKKNESFWRISGRERQSDSGRQHT